MAAEDLAPPAARPQCNLAMQLHAVTDLAALLLAADCAKRKGDTQQQAWAARMAVLGQAARSDVRRSLVEINSTLSDGVISPGVCGPLQQPSMAGDV
mmetsp:Transcript_13/g.54  ORF Transcript_13/g.54 Transcript_13/m.54 type:complete len:97 (-) Transcript_13:3788-4078(-)